MQELVPALLGMAAPDDQQLLMFGAAVARVVERLYSNPLDAGNQHDTRRTRAAAAILEMTRLPKDLWYVLRGNLWSPNNMAVRVPVYSVAFSRFLVWPGQHPATLCLHVPVSGNGVILEWVTPYKITQFIMQYLPAQSAWEFRAPLNSHTSRVKVCEFVQFMKTHFPTVFSDITLYTATTPRDNLALYRQSGLFSNVLPWPQTAAHQG